MSTRTVRTAGAAAAGGTGETGSLIPNTLEDLRGRTPEELRAMFDILEAHLRDLHQSETGELRELDEAEQTAFDAGMEIRQVDRKSVV